MSTGKRAAFVTLILLTITGVVFYGDFHRSAMFLVNVLNTSHSSMSSHPLKIYRDLSSEFENDAADTGSRFSVLEALKLDGLRPVAVSDGYLHPTSAGQLRVPNVVHYVFLGSDLNFTFVNYLSYRSVDRFIRPDQIFVHGDHVPSGKWWNCTVSKVKNIYHVRRNYSKNAPNGQPYRYPAHISDYMRTETLLSYGGIYLDADVLVVKSFNPLRQFPFVAGRETGNGLCNGIMVAERGAPFLRLLLEQYHSYLGPKEIWMVKSVLIPDELARIYPHLVHVEETTLNRPNYKEKVLIFDRRYNWTQNYAVHLWIRLWPNVKRPNGLEDILTKNTTIGELARLAIFGSHVIRKIAINAVSSVLANSTSA